MNNDDETSMNEIVLMNEDDFAEMESDIAYWSAAATMLTEILQSHGIEYDLSEEVVMEYLKRKETDAELN
jgi:hypothetical protein